MFQQLTIAMYFVIFLLAFILIWLLFGNRIKEWLRNLMYRKMEDAIRAQMGMPSRKEEKRRQRAAAGAARNDSAGRPGSRRRRRPGESIIPEEYAEDVEFTEYKDFSATERKYGSSDYRVEEQVEDVEYTEIRTNDRRK